MKPFFFSCGIVFSLTFFFFFFFFSIFKRFGVLRDGLFNKALSGTKAQIERYNETVVRALNAICDAPTPNKWWEEAALKEGEEGVGDRKESLNENETIPTDVKVWKRERERYFLYIF